MSAWLIFAAGLIVLPQAEGGAASRRVPDSYPTSAVREGKSGAVQIRIWFDQSGQSYRCEVLNVYGDEVFGREACKPSARVKLGPAMAPNGSPTHSSVTSFVRYMLDGRSGREIRQMKEPSDLVLLAELPSGQSLPDFQIAVQIRPDGSVDYCEGLKDGSAELYEVACDEAKRQAWTRGTDRQGSPVSYVRRVLVAVEASSG